LASRPPAVTAPYIAALACGVLLGTGALKLGLTSAWVVPFAAAFLAGAVAATAFRHLSRSRTRRRQAALDSFVARELARTFAPHAPFGARRGSARVVTIDER
jgi:hypothetical protein